MIERGSLYNHQGLCEVQPNQPHCHKHLLGGLVNNNMTCQMTDAIDLSAEV